VFGPGRLNWLKASRKMFWELHGKEPFNTVMSQQAAAPNIFETAKGSKKLLLISSYRGMRN